MNERVETARRRSSFIQRTVCYWTWDASAR